MTKLVSFNPAAGGDDKVLIGVLSRDEASITELLHPASGEPVTDLFDVIEQWDAFEHVTSSLCVSGKQNGAAAAAGKVHSLDSIKFAAPLRGRDVLAVGKNYVDHAKEFNKSGYDSSDKNDIPDFPVIFSKRASSIVAHETEVYPHPAFTKTLDYEGELGVIIGKGGARITKENAMDHVWGYTIINDVTARERQRDHKQFLIGKSLDTFCPVGPYLVPKRHLDVNDMEVETKVNGETRQKANTSQLIFDIPTLLETISAGITLQPGDMIATGTPAGVGFGLPTPTFLKGGDVVEVSISGIGTLRNRIADPAASYPSVAPVRVTRSASAKASSADSALLSLPSGKQYHVEESGTSSGPALVFIHGLGGNLGFFHAILQESGVAQSHRIILIDWEGHGRTPSQSASLSVASIASDILAVFDHLSIPEATLVAHSMGGLIATHFASAHPTRVSGAVLLGPVKALGAPGKDAMKSRAASVRAQGMLAVADTICNVGLSERTKSQRSLSVAFTRASLLSTPAEGYAQACLALGRAEDPDYSKIACPVLFVGGSEDKTSPAATIQSLGKLIKGAKAVTLQDVGHWHAIEDVKAVAELLNGFATGQ
ncbi:fumarylacetoacetate hydrolase [Moesziomyces antarcticus]|uniref:Related to 2-keto-4-pentenoate hydratase/2-oxohepta-3-ene-1,7-dioic acid hydratase (Catechol pathway) n=2 Tax=Pseudozyma antarctica TaxID=84753 RepID=A0A5C3FKK7_PSEA2|nr:fumarylacetoacetate hydrolase [Moesziomyces antarcticus]GAK64597.1 fumarylacetoacetate hydrolase [Moesziomyces antarcticus]SPO44894.1 related to 2-keto-4-pentenoate hydratase/2-oxohepta-3-ene-1,7-dioic acid hydratase (catechol pathway) [Moesziomyces antarcticus]